MSHVVPCGGVSLLPNFIERLKADMGETCPRSLRFNMHVAPGTDRAKLVHIGGSVLAHIAASLPDFWVTKAEYDEAGPSAVRRKCF